MISDPESINTYSAQYGNLAQLVGPRGKNFIIRLAPGKRLETHRGIIKHDDLVGKTWGSMVYSHLGRSFILLQPSLSDILKETKRSTQILYPKDIGFILVTMGIGPGQNILEAGTGSGALTTALAYSVGPQGHITTYEVRPEMQSLAQKNLERIGLSERVTFKLKNIGEGFDETGADALFLDLPNPYDYIPQVRSALKPGGFFGCILPTTNQITHLLISLSRENFAFIEVCEIFLRYYQVIPERFRPVDRMIAHTGYLIFARPVSPLEDKSLIETNLESMEEPLPAAEDEDHEQGIEPLIDQEE